MLKFVLFFLLIFISLSWFSPVSAQEFTWNTDEDLTYGVDWTFIRLGEIHLKLIGREEINGKMTNHIRLIIESNPLLFWLDNQSVYDSYVTDSLKVMRFISDEKVDGKLYNARYDFDYDKEKIYLSLLSKENNEARQDKVIDLKPKLYDGISLIYFARKNSLYIKPDTVSTFIEDKSGNVMFNFLDEKHMTQIDAAKSDIQTVYFDGQLDVTGIAGVTGPFKAWFSDDSYRVPILAHLDVFIGSVKISLEKWKDWTPPY